MKSCPCGSLGPFYRNASRPDGLSFYCKACTAVQRREEYARKYPNGKGPRGAVTGNKNAIKHGRYAGYKRSKPVREIPYLDVIISMAIA